MRGGGFGPRGASRDAATGRRVACVDGVSVPAIGTWIGLSGSQSVVREAHSTEIRERRRGADWGGEAGLWGGGGGGVYVSTCMYLGIERVCAREVVPGEFTRAKVATRNLRRKGHSGVRERKVASV